MFSRLKIAAKIAVVTSLLCVMAGFALWYASSRLTEIGARYDRFVARENRGFAGARHVARSVFEIGYALDRAVAAPDAAARQPYLAQVDASQARLRQVMAELPAQLPAFASRIAAQAGAVERFAAESLAVRRMIEAGEASRAAAQVRQVVDPLTKTATERFGALSDDIAAAIEAEAAGLAAETRAAQGMTHALGLCAVAAGFVLAMVMSAFGITRPLNRLIAAMNRMAEGEVEARLVETRRGDEVGAVARAVEGIKAMVARKVVEDAERGQQAVSASSQERRGMLIGLAEEFEREVGGISGAIASASAQLQDAARTMSSTATESAAQSTAVAAAAEQAAANVHTVAAAAEELGSSVQEIGRQVDGAARLAEAAVAQAGRTGEAVQGLSQAAARIGDVTEMISTIAAQTNLLALNATIEAARAGAAGRGFAVVAAEVKALADQTARATAEIAGQVGAVRDSTGTVVAAIDGIAGSIREISGVSASIAAAVEEQDAATQEIVRNVSQAATGTGEVTGNIGGVAQAAEGTGRAASQVLDTASGLSRQSDRLAAEVRRFVDTIRAA
ncbi:HAMP domain-containing methyl-accepting chemotaxis protein [Methylobacterium sp. 17Sr1-1]|uniref:methyl-accepting chemotaxis protein n=1 Tax=Methylobacterium sp. 17Sr1-1 TaxID=2202826 RepID=UPI000D701D7C|nr:HAMP domain-containing methyl-accepting chemotaxis protein [Methylobacterium sp. 17Sr1-1]AWN51619.1 methyl-accepting chemotaxis protein [Methylobacterium sp. 17Sr1-1]